MASKNGSAQGIPAYGLEEAFRHRGIYPCCNVAPLPYRSLTWLPFLHNVAPGLTGYDARVVNYTTRRRPRHATLRSSTPQPITVTRYCGYTLRTTYGRTSYVESCGLHRRSTAYVVSKTQRAPARAVGARHPLTVGQATFLPLSANQNTLPCH